MKKIIALALGFGMLGSVTLNAQNAKAKTKTKSKAMTAVNSKETIVELSTDYGTMKIKLYNETPKHRDNFLKLAGEGYYNGLLFHRVIKNFMIQGGDPESKNAAADKMLGNGGPGYTIPAEFNEKLFHKKGALAAARTGDQINPKKESSGSQFYIVQGKVYNDGDLNQMQVSMGSNFSPEARKAYTTTGGVPFLDRNYTVFGEVISGMEVIDKIAAVITNPGDRPAKDVKMTMKVLH